MAQNQFQAKTFISIYIYIIQNINQEKVQNVNKLNKNKNMHKLLQSPPHNNTEGLTVLRILLGRQL